MAWLTTPSLSLIRWVRRVRKSCLLHWIEDPVELRPLKRLIIERSGGNPFFIEEMVRALFDQGALVRNGAVKITRSLSQLRLPTTVQGMLAARIDRQPGDHKQLLQTLAVLGRESSLGLLSQVASHSSTELERILADLQAGEFIYDRPTAIGVELVFKHALTQEVAYNSLLIERRKQLHERAGEALEAIFAGQSDDHLDEMAHHYSHSDNVDKAIEYLGRAGQQAVQRSSHVEAIGKLSDALELLQKLPNSTKRTSRELPLQLALGQAFIPSKGWSAVEVEQPFKRARAICGQLDNPRELFPALFGLWSVYHVRGQYNEARESGARLLELAESLDDRISLIMAHYALGETFLHTVVFYWRASIK
jgi:predicted ATPase